MKKLLILLPLFLYNNLHADTTHSGIPGTINITTSVNDLTRNWGDKVNENFGMVSATMNTVNSRVAALEGAVSGSTGSLLTFISTVGTGVQALFDAQINASSYTLQGNLVTISTVASGVNQLANGLMNASSYTLQGNLVTISTVASGVNQLANGLMNASSYTLQGNLINISTVAGGVNQLANGLMNASSYTLQGNLVTISTVAGGVNKIISGEQVVDGIDLSTTGTGVQALNDGATNASSYTLQGNLVDISTTARGVNELKVFTSTIGTGVQALYDATVNASSYTMQGNRVDISTTAQGVQALYDAKVNASSYTMQGPRVSSITQNQITSDHLKVTNSPADNQVLTYDNATRNFSWADDATGGGGNDFRAYKVIIGTTSTFGANIVGTSEQAFQAAISSVGGGGSIFVQASGATSYMLANVAVPSGVEIVFEASATVKNRGVAPTFLLQGGKLINPQLVLRYPGLTSKQPAIQLSSDNSKVIGGQTILEYMDTNNGVPTGIIYVNLASNTVVDGHKFFVDDVVNAGANVAYITIHDSTGVFITRNFFNIQDRVNISDRMIYLQGGANIQVLQNVFDIRMIFLDANLSLNGDSYGGIKISGNIIKTAGGFNTGNSSLRILTTMATDISSGCIVVENNQWIMGDNTAGSGALIELYLTAAGKIEGVNIKGNIVNSASEAQVGQDFIRISNATVFNTCITDNHVWNLDVFITDSGNGTDYVGNDNYLNGVEQ